MQLIFYHTDVPYTCNSAPIFVALIVAIFKPHSQRIITRTGLIILTPSVKFQHHL